MGAFVGPTVSWRRLGPIAPLLPVCPRADTVLSAAQLRARESLPRSLRRLSGSSRFPFLLSLHLRAVLLLLQVPDVQHLSEQLQPVLSLPLASAAGMAHGPAGGTHQAA